ncbi:MAG TPA: hypothetical protein VN604_08935 [Nitrospirota bacterium]|nr:hypothetical protein [Nitrospirota bacterium]
MKRYGRIILLFATAIVVVVITYVVRVVTEPVSSMIAKERDRLARSSWEEDEEGDPGAAAKLRAKLEALDFQLAVAYNAEGRAGKAAAVLEGLIKAEQAKGGPGGTRSAQSFRNEARYYETMTESCVQMKDACAERARHRRLDALSRAEEQKRREMLGEGRNIRRGVE